MVVGLGFYGVFVFYVVGFPDYFVVDEIVKRQDDKEDGWEKDDKRCEYRMTEDVDSWTVEMDC